MATKAQRSTQDDKLKDAQMEVADKPEKVVLPTNESSESLIRIRHTCAHVMAMAVQKVFPDAKVTIGPWMENGFYYDFDMEPLTDKELKRIKKEMIEKEINLKYAEFLIGDEWWDLCAGPHVEKTGNINRKAVELESIAGAYWRGDEKKPMLQRIYGTAWESEDQLKAYLHFKEEAKRRDHRHLGQVLDLFSRQIYQLAIPLFVVVRILALNIFVVEFSQNDAGGGLVFWRPRGAIVRYELSGSLHGLSCVKGFTQDGVHIFCLEDQIKDEIRGVLDLTEELLLQFGFRNLLLYDNPTIQA
ncbi:threonine--tRNA ligase, chloroplastic/mitochondrial 2-like [Pyrus x bretschneideri]|uniref:threonine--tRNA ligase, chloroplastic/mitochondrial 2-like n=1 Tax=Pyrus x bretschneideri TaxID=225117 RepID=UPI0020307AF1|nr:threonine--tRNA ligase, chloroplastic/mitochondrial 2-like [Pyrus x bretschneideri]